MQRFKQVDEHKGMSFQVFYLNYCIKIKKYSYLLLNLNTKTIIDYRLQRLKNKVYQKTHYIVKKFKGTCNSSLHNT